MSNPNPSLPDPFNGVLDLAPHAAALTRAFELFWEEFVDPGAGIVYDAPMRHPEVWPTPAEVAANIPTIHGWDTAIENAPSLGGSLLAGLAWEAFDLAPQRRRACLNQIFNGLVSLWEVPGRTGFICRGYLRASTSFYIQTSVDQVPIYLFGLWMYHRSPLCLPEHRRLIAAIFDSVLNWFKGQAWSLRLFDGRPAVHGDILNLRDPSMARYLALLLMASDVTGDAAWRAVYREWREADGRARFADISKREKIWEPYTSFYQCVSLRALELLDPDCADYYLAERRVFAYHINSFCGAHIYAAFWPALKGEKTIHVRPDRLIDWRPAHAAVKADAAAGDPEKPRYWYTYRLLLEQMRAEQGVRGDGWLTLDYFSLLGTLALCQGYPQPWLYSRPTRSISAFFDRLSTAHPLRFLPTLAFSLGIRNWLTHNEPVNTNTGKIS